MVLQEPTFPPSRENRVYAFDTGPAFRLVESSRCLGVQLDNELKWDTHVNEVIKSYTKKLNLLRSMHFLPVKPRTDFYFKVILPSITYGIAVWGSCGSMLFIELEKIHVRAAKFIYKLDWLTPSEEVLQRLNWHTLKTAYITRMLVLTYTSFHGTAPTGIQERFQKHNCKYGLRRKNCFTLPKPTVRLNYGMACTIRSGQSKP